MCLDGFGWLSSCFSPIFVSYDAGFVESRATSVDTCPDSIAKESKQTDEFIIVPLKLKK
jgi:hypothetical protein